MKRRLLLFFLLISSFAFGQNNIYRSGGITQTVGAPTFTPGASGNIVAIDTVTGEWYVNPNRLSGASWISAGYRLTNISGSVPPAYTPTAHQSHFVVNAANELYYWDGSAWQSVGGGGSGDATRLKFLVVNKSGGTLNKGEVVYVSGAQGNRVAVKKALASADSLSANTLGVMDETVLSNAEGYCVAEGLVSGINTSAFTEGAALYLSPTTAGAITQTKPTAPNHLVLIGYCVKSNAGSGEISVHIQNGYELGELHDVYVPAPSNGQVLTYNTTNTRWEAATVADQSATNELQTIDTFSLSGQTLSASLSSDNQPAKTVTLPIVDVVAGTNVTVTKSNGVATVSATGGGGGGGISDLNGLTASTQTFATGTTGTDFNISSATSTHTFNLPTASATNRGALSSADWSTFNSRVSGSGTSGQVSYWNGTTSQTGNAGLIYSPSLGLGSLGIGQSPNCALDIISNTSPNTTLRLNSNAFSIPNFSSVGINPAPLSGSFAYWGPYSGGYGGAFFSGFQGTTAGAAPPLYFIGYGHSPTLPSGWAAIVFDGAKHNGSTNSQSLASTDIIARFANRGSYVASIFANGSLLLSSATSTSAKLQSVGTGTGSTTYSLICTNSGANTATAALAVRDDSKVGIGTNSVDSGATFEVDGTTGGILFPRLTTTQRDALTPTNGLMIYNTTTSKFQGYAGGAWVDLH